MNVYAILVTVDDRLGLLSDLSKVLADHQANITYVDIHSTGPPRTSTSSSRSRMVRWLRSSAC
jgi:uncharacterized protein with ACT and thioredoxin-like domain